MATGQVTKKRRSDGTIRWQARIDMGKGADGTRIRKTKEFKAKRDALDQLTRWRGELSAGILAPRTNQTLADYLRDWLASKRGTVAPSTHEEYTWQMTKQVIPQLGTVPLEKLTTRMIEHWRDKEHARGLTPRGVNHPLSLLKAALKRAVILRILTRDPAEHVAFIRDRKVQRPLWQVADVRTFLEGAKDDPLYAAWLLALTTSMRRGELTGLCWEDVNLETGIIRVRHAITLEGSAPDLDVPKSDAGERAVSLSGLVRSALMQHAVRQSELAELSPEWKDRGYVFTTRKGTAYHPDYLSHHFPKLCAAIGVPHVPLHALRKTAIALALSVSGGDIKAVSRRSGHSRTDITMDIYAYVLEGQDMGLAQGVEALLFGPRPPGAHPERENRPLD